MTIDFQRLIFDIELAVNRAKSGSKLRLDCEDPDTLALILEALKIEKIASVIERKKLTVSVLLIGYYEENEIPVCSDCGEPLGNTPDDSTQENPTLGEKDTIIFSANEATIIALMGALLSVSKARGLFEDDDNFSDLLYNAIDCGVSDVERVPDIMKNQLLITAKDMVSFHVKKNERSSES